MIPKLRKAVQGARRHKRERLKGVKEKCQQRRAQLREQAQAARLRLREKIAATKARAQDTCRLMKARATEEELDAIEAALGALAAEREEIAKLRYQASRMKSARGAAGGRRAAELRAESDDFVRAELGDDAALVALWDRVKRKIKATPYMSRIEAFYQHVHDNPADLDEMQAVLEQQWEAEAERMFRERAEQPPIGALGDEELTGYLAELASIEQHLAKHPYQAGDVPF